MRQANGPAIPGRGPDPLPIDSNREAVAFMEWSNTIALVWDKQGETVTCTFTEKNRRTRC
jgi:hypothetical protein